jgi:NAD(P)-dependent dehydrogenase (short-subunit alcohol dehydrogenase family)
MSAHHDRLAIVTGTTRGIGAATAALLLERGWQVVGIARRAASIDHERYRHVVFDLERSADLVAMANDQLAGLVSDSRWRRVALVNNAALGGLLGPIEAVDPVGLARVSAVNWVAPAWLIGFMLRHVRPEAALRIVNVSSGAAVRAFPGLADYCGSKAALRMTGMVAAAELESPLRRAEARTDTAILSYEPGTVDTAMQEAARSRPLAEYPWGGLFRDFAASGALVPPSAPAADIVEFVEGNGRPSFSERRLRS